MRVRTRAFRYQSVRCDYNDCCFPVPFGTGMYKEKVMKAISIKQPWASLIVNGIKDIENRSWKCPKKYIGKRVLIHASYLRSSLDLNMKQKDKLSFDNLSHYICLYYDLPRGAIIGSVVISDCVQNHPSIWAEKGCWNWVLKDAILFDHPIKDVKGKLGFWNYNIEESNERKE